MNNSLLGQTAIISGGLGDIGRAIALELMQRGADIAIGDLKEENAAAEQLALLRRDGRRARYDPVDVSDSAAVQQWVKAVEADLGPPSLIIPNAARVTLADAMHITPADWAAEIAVNLNGAFHLAQAAALRLLQRKRGGRIVFVGSWAAHAPHVNIPAYCAAKAGLRMLCQCMALQLAEHDILVNEVAPGYVDAGLSGRIFDQDPALKQRAIQEVPIHRLIKSEEVAMQVAHLCDPANIHMTGSVLLMDGGLSLGSPAWRKE